MYMENSFENFCLFVYKILFYVIFLLVFEIIGFKVEEIRIKKNKVILRI